MVRSCLLVSARATSSPYLFVGFHVVDAVHPLRTCCSWRPEDGATSAAGTTTRTTAPTAVSDGVSAPHLQRLLAAMKKRTSPLRGGREASSDTNQGSVANTAAAVAAHSVAHTDVASASVTSSTAAPLPVPPYTQASIPTTSAGSTWYVATTCAGCACTWCMNRSSRVR